MMQASKESRTRNDRVLALLLAAMIVASLLLLTAARPAAALAGDTLAWGDNDSGQLGDGTYDPTNTPVKVSNLGNVRTVRAGFDHSLALKEDGTVWAWGYNGAGQLGNGTFDDSTTPVEVKTASGATLGSVKAIAVGSEFNLALKSNGTVWAWGYNGDGQLGNGTFDGTNVPMKVSNLSGIKAIAAGEYHSLALKEDGMVRTWGANGDGQLGNGTFDDSTTPVEVKTASGAALSSVKAIAVGGNHSLAVKMDGTVRTWGDNFNGQLGNGTNDDRNVPVKVKTASGTTLGGIKAVAGGEYHSLALKEDGTVLAWGNNFNGQLGNGSSGLDSDSNVPVQVSNLSGVKAIAAGYAHSLALKEDGTVRTWGANGAGQLGNGSSGLDSDSNVPVRVKTASGTTLSGIKAIAAGYAHSLAVKQ